MRIRVCIYICITHTQKTSNKDKKNVRVKHRMNYEKAHIYNPHTHNNGTKYDLHKKTGNKDKQKSNEKHCMRICIYMYICPHTKNRPQEQKEFAHEASYEVCEGSYISSTQNQKLVKYHPYKKKATRTRRICAWSTVWSMKRLIHIIHPHKSKTHKIQSTQNKIRKL